MCKKVYTYNKITELKKAPYFAEIAPLPQITMSQEMARNMTYDMRVFRGNVMGFFNFSMRVFPDWNTGGQKFAYVTALNQFLREKISNAKDKAERDWLFGCKKNLYSAITNIIRLEEAKVHPEDFKDLDRDLLLFIEMWKYLEDLDDHIVQFRQRLKVLEDPERFEHAMNRIFRFHGCKKIVFHGFHSFTPLQQFIYDCFVRSGYEIYALIQDELRYPYANEIWNYLYNKENGYPDRKDWIRQEDLKIKNPLGEIFETGEETEAPNVKILRYANTIEFVEDIKRIKDEGFYLYCADDRSANAMLKDYFPERYEVRNLLSYPIGQFIYTLHKMWDENLQCIVLNPDGLRKCFASGWISINGESSMNYTEDLERLLPYFEGCYTVEEWGKRVDSFLNAYDQVLDLFSISRGDRRVEILGNPFKYFGVFSIHEKRIDQVMGLIKRLIEMAKTLFGSSEPISIQKHMSRLDAMLYMDDGMPRELYMEEKEKVKQIFKALESDKVKDFMCYPGDLAAALLAFMGGRMEDEEENNQGLQTLVFNIFQIEAAPISTKGKIHICLSDITRLPGSSGKYYWPMDESLLESVCESKKDCYISNWIENGKLTALSNRYYIYTALKNEQVEISWIQQQSGKLYAPSPYITLLDKLAKAEIKNAEVRKLNYQSVTNIMPHTHVKKEFDLREHPELHDYDKELEYALCPMRFVYGYVLNEHPAYRNEYQQSRAIMRFIQILTRLLENRYTIEEVAEQVFELFPYIRKAEKRQMIDDASQWKLPEENDGSMVYKDYNFTNRRLNLTFLDEETYIGAKKLASMLMSPEGRHGIFCDRKGEEKSRNCEFCPHESYCMKSLFGIDYKGERE